MAKTVKASYKAQTPVKKFPEGLESKIKAYEKAAKAAAKAKTKMDATELKNCVAKINEFET